jgi:hypothetical protein
MIAVDQIGGPGGIPGRRHDGIEPMRRQHRIET